MRKGNLATLVMLAAAMLMAGCGQSGEATSDEAKATFIAECTAAGVDESEVSAAQMGAYCECMAEPTVAMQAHMAGGTMPDAAETKKMQEATIACMKHLE